MININRNAAGKLKAIFKIFNNFLEDDVGISYTVYGIRPFLRLYHLRIGTVASRSPCTYSYFSVTIPLVAFQKFLTIL